MPSFIENFVNYAAGCEAPQAFVMWTAISSLASLVSRRVWVDQGYFRIYPNLYVVLVALPGDRKTITMNMSYELLRNVGGVNLSADCMTKEAVCKHMAENCVKQFIIPGTDKNKQYTPLTLCLTELTHFLGTNNSAHMIDFLVTIYDKEVYETKTKGRGNDLIPGPFLNILACTTPSAITRYLKEDVISGGFSRRALFIYQLEPGEPVSWPIETPEAKDAMNACIAWGQQLQEVSGEFIPEEGFKEWYDDIYKGLFAHAVRPQETMTRGYYRSKHIQAFKIAMLVSLSESTDLVLKKDHFERALALLEHLEINLPKVYEGMGRNEMNAVASKLLELLNSAGEPVPEKKVLAIMYREADVRELHGMLQHLKATEKILEFKQEISPGVTRRLLTTPEIAVRLKLVSGDSATNSPAE